MIAPARRAAFDILRAVNSRRDDLPSALARIREPLPDPRDRSLATEIATGTLRWRLALDFLIETFARRPVAKLDPEVLDVLRLSAYQLLHLTRVPPSAVVDDGVALTRAVRKRSASGFANAVLRRIAEVRAAPPFPPRPDSPAAPRDTVLDYLSVTWSHPRWLAARWLDRVGFAAAEARVRFNNATPPLMLRANTLRVNRDALIDQLAAEGIAVTPARYAASGLRVTDGNPLRTALAHTGLFALQDEASQLVADLVRAAPGMTVLDVCASPGGKTAAIAAAMRGQGLIVAMDVSEPRIDLLGRTVAELGATQVRVVQADAARGVPCPAVFDWILVDAPCSGLGTIRRDPDIRWRRDESDLTRLAVLQARLLAESAAAVRPGGFLVYATCSSEPEENERVVASVVATRGDLVRLDARTLDLPDGARSVIDADGYLRTTPEDHELELFFGAVLRRHTAHD